MIRSVSLVLIALLASGCGHFQPVEPGEAEPLSQPAPEPEPDIASTWLLKRQTLCSEESEVQRARLRDDYGQNEHDRIKRVLLASCGPEHTPGLLRETLSELPDNPDRDIALQALLDLLRDHSRSYRILEERNRQLASQLENTIEGIRQIEADMENLRRNRRNP